MADFTATSNTISFQGSAIVTSNPTEIEDDTTGDNYIVCDIYLDRYGRCRIAILSTLTQASNVYRYSIMSFNTEHQGFSSVMRLDPLSQKEQIFVIDTALS